jgi:hypothetical protein
MKRILCSLLVATLPRQRPRGCVEVVSRFLDQLVDPL